MIPNEEVLAEVLRGYLTRLSVSLAKLAKNPNLAMACDAPPEAVQVLMGIAKDMREAADAFEAMATMKGDG